MTPPRNLHFFGMFRSLAAVVGLFVFVTADARSAETPTRLEVFVTADTRMSEEADIESPTIDGRIDVQFYEIDAIRHVESELSKDLVPDPEQSRRIVLRRIQQLPDTDRARMQSAATGLAKSLYYGIDRYPAIVLDREFVIYGVTDIREALHRYQQWREGRRQ